MDPQYYAFDQSRRRNMLSWKDIKSTGTMLKELVGGLGLSQKDFGNAVKGSFKELSSQRAQGLSYWTSTRMQYYLVSALPRVPSRDRMRRPLASLWMPQDCGALK